MGDDVSFTIRVTPDRVTGDYALFEGDRREDDVEDESAVRVSSKTKARLWNHLDELDSDPRVFDEQEDLDGRPAGFEELGPL
jgi:hypothetical protein